MSRKSKKSKAAKARLSSQVRENSTIRKLARKSKRYMDVYRKGLTEKLAEFAVKKYKSHRRIPNEIKVFKTTF